jgi:hypothetical protein
MYRLPPSVYCPAHLTDFNTFKIREEIRKRVPKRMTIDIYFKQNGKPVAKVNMTESHFWERIAEDKESSMKEKQQEHHMWFMAIYNEEKITDKKYIEKAWNACLRWGYISEGFDILIKYVDELEIMW